MKFDVVNGDLGNLEITTNCIKVIKTVFHMAAYPEVKTGFDNTALS